MTIRNCAWIYSPALIVNIEYRIFCASKPLVPVSDQVLGRII